jgi:hypothetical protein
MRLSELLFSGGPSAWESIGFTVRGTEADSQPESPVIVVPDVVLRFDANPESASRLVGWAFSDDEATTNVRSTEIDGIPTRIVSGVSVPSADEHRLDIIGVDHVVVMTGSLERTSDAITDTVGEPLRRIRDAGHGVRQGFHRAGSVILEVVERPDLASTTSASLWGVVFVVRDLDAVVEWLGPDAISSPRDAVQDGRRIATIRNDVGLGVPVALMTPHQRA